MSKFLEIFRDPIFAGMVLCILIASSAMYPIYKYWDYHQDLKDRGIILIWDPGVVGQYKPYDVKGQEIKTKQ